jgi:hypothetical protein
MNSTIGSLNYFPTIIFTTPLFSDAKYSIQKFYVALFNYSVRYLHLSSEFAGRPSMTHNGFRLGDVADF